MSNLVSRKCVNFVKGFEGFSTTVYLDEVGVPTLGYGMTGKEIEGLDYVTEEQASNMLEDLMNNKYATPLKADLDSKGVVLTQNEFDALVSMAYNVGVGGVLGSTLYKNVCAGVRDRDKITSNFQMWCMGGGRRIEGLYRRRTEEANMFFGDSATSSSSQPQETYADSNVLAIQRILNRLRIANLDEDGIMGNQTRQAIKDFQYICGIDEDGIWGNQCQNCTNQIFNKPLCGIPYVQRVATRYIQWRLGIAIDGIFGNGTAAAVKEWQRANELEDDEIVGNMSWSELIG